MFTASLIHIWYARDCHLSILSLFVNLCSYQTRRERATGQLTWYDVILPSVSHTDLARHTLRVKHANYTVYCAFITYSPNVCARRVCSLYSSLLWHLNRTNWIVCMLGKNSYYLDNATPLNMEYSSRNYFSGKFRCFFRCLYIIIIIIIILSLIHIIITLDAI